MFASKKTFTLDGLASFSLPADWVQSDTHAGGNWTAQRFRKSLSFRWGSGNPLEVDGWVILGNSRASIWDLETGMSYALEQVTTNTMRFSEFGNMLTDTRTTWMSEGSYQIASNHNPEKVIFLRSLDLQKRCALVVRVHQRKIKHEKLRSIERDYFATVQPLNGNPVSNPATGAANRAILQINQFLVEKGLKPIASGGKAQALNGWVYQIEEGNFQMARRLVDRPQPGSGIARFVDKNSYWQSADLELSLPVTTSWKSLLALDTDRTRQYFFAIGSFPLTAAGADTLPAWFEKMLHQ